MMDNQVDQYERRFTKFQEVLANIGGLFKGICLIALIINYFFFNELFHMNLISSIFPFEDLKKKRRTSILNYQSPRKNIEITGNMLNLESHNVEATQSNTQNKNFKYLNRPNDLKFKFYELICIQLRKNTGKIKTFKLAKQYTQNLLCVKSILSKMSEINKVKCLTFNKEQLQLYNCIPTPSYHNLNSKTQDIWEYVVLPKKQMDTRYILDSFKKKEEYSEIDENFLNILKIYNKV
jgi:hypothetical protein